MEQSQDFKQWLTDNNYTPTIGTPRDNIGLPDYHLKNNKLFNTLSLCIEYHVSLEQSNN